MNKNKFRVYRGEIYLADLDGNVGSEQGGVRPVVILQNDIGNNFSKTTIVAPITTRNKKDLPTHVKFINYKKLQVNYILLEQLRCIDKIRLHYKTGKIEDNILKEVEDVCKISLGFKEILE